ncbi:MAG: exodeoxyribonuclease V subunit alpha [Spirochaetia bacterium]|nr:exodeoxyribonuclease V subunit alpha [Spirochaetia bacterium]
MSVYQGNIQPSVLLKGRVDADVGAFLDQASTAYLDPASVLTIRDLVGYLERGGDPSLGAGVLAFLYFALSEGSLCLPLTGAAFDRFSRRLCATAPAASSVVNRLTGGIDVMRCLGPLLSSESSEAPLVFERTEKRLYFQRYFSSQETIADKLRAFLARDSRDIDLQSAASAVRDVVGAWETGSGPRLSPDQALAVASALFAPLSVITGGPGTGKTFVVMTLLRVFMRLGFDTDQIRLAAPTGRAARRLSESINAGLGLVKRPSDVDLKLPAIPSSTIHSLIGFRGGSARFGTTNPLPARLVIVDEVSMVDVVLMARLLEAVDVSRTRLIFLGDRNQLPSVDAGAVLSDLIRLFLPRDGVPVYTDDFRRFHAGLLPGSTFPSAVTPEQNAQPGAGSNQGFRDRITLLNTSHRSTPAVMNAASSILAGLPEGLNAFTNIFARMGEPAWPERDGAYFLNVPAGVDASALAVSWNMISFSEDAMLRDLERTAYNPADAEMNAKVAAALMHSQKRRILCVLRRGPRGVEWINRALKRAVCRRMKVPAADIYSGMPIILLRNDPARRLFNGDTGIVAVFADGVPRAAFLDQGGRVFLFPLDVLPAWEPAYAMTVHKSQGSEFDEVLMILPDDPAHRLLTGEIVYTGLTRAKKQVVLLGSEDAVRHSGDERAVRDTGLLSW